MNRLFSEVVCASFPSASLWTLAELRAQPGVRVALIGDVAWVRWEPDDERVLRAVLPVSGIRLYCHREGRWYRHGSHLPAFDFPANADYRPLPELLTPLVIRPIPAPRSAQVSDPAGRPMSAPALVAQPVQLRLVKDTRIRPASALQCSAADLARWSDTVPTARLQTILAASKQGDLLLLSNRLPPLADGQRYYGSEVLVPLGCRVDPEFSETDIKEALEVSEDELLLMRPNGTEVIRRDVFQPLTRSRLKLLLRDYPKRGD